MAEGLNLRVWFRYRSEELSVPVKIGCVVKSSLRRKTSKTATTLLNHLQYASAKTFIYGAVDLRFKSLAVKSDTVLSTIRHRCDISSKGVVLPAGAMTRRWAPQTRYTLRRNTASTMKHLILWYVLDYSLNRWTPVTVLCFHFTIVRFFS